MTGIVQTGVFPDGSELDELLDIEWNRFAVCDVDRDGRGELLLLADSFYSGQIRTYIYEYKPETDTLHQQAVIYPGAEILAGDTLVSIAERNHSNASLSLGRSLTPYSIYQYDTATDTYQFVMEVSAWDKYCFSKNFREKADADGDGMVYCFTPEGIWQDGAAYEAWFAEFFGKLEEEKIFAYWVPLKENYIELLQ